MIKLLDNHKYSEVFKELVFFIETSKIVYRNIAPSKFLMYNGNCCRQTAFLSYMFLSEHIPEYDWAIYESTFKSVSNNFEHSWCFGHEKGSSPLLGIFADLAYTSDAMKNFLFEGSNDFPGDISEIDAGCLEIKTMRKKTSLDFYFDSNEFYTGLKGKDLYNTMKELSSKRKDYENKNGVN